MSSVSEKPDFITLRHEGTCTYKERRSVFLGNAAPVKTEDEALSFLATVRKRYPDARHTVYAYLVRTPGVMRYSDDGEPQGSAGVPVLDVLRKRGITDAVITVTRYFGGVLLGRGGLLRAYTEAAAGAVRAADILTYTVFRQFCITLSYADYPKVQPLLVTAGVRVESTDFSQQVLLRATMPLSAYDTFAARVSELTAGRCLMEVSQDLYDC